MSRFCVGIHLTYCMWAGVSTFVFFFFLAPSTSSSRSSGAKIANSLRELRGAWRSIQRFSSKNCERERGVSGKRVH